MVTIQEARQQLTQSRQAIQQQQQRVTETRREIEQVKLPKPTREELQVRGREDIRQRKIREGNLEALKREKLTELKPFQEQIAVAEGEVTEFESDIKAAEAEQAKQNRFQDILSRIARDRPIPPGTTPQEVARAEKFLEPFKQRTVQEVQIMKEIRKLKETPKVSIPSKVKEGFKKIPVSAGAGGIIFKPGERPDEKIFVPTEELKLERITAQDILSREIFFEEPKIIPVKAQEFGANIQKKLESAKIKTLVTLLPTVKAEVNQQKQEANKIQAEFKEIDKEIIAFNKKFGSETLSEAQFNEATKQQTALNIKIDKFEKLITDTEKAQRDRVKQKNKLEPGLGTLAEGLLVGGFSAPFDFASFIVGGVTQPKRTILGFGASVSSLPSQFKEAPFSTLGFTAAQILVQSKLANVAFKGIKKGAVKLGKGGKIFFNIKKVNTGNTLFQKFLQGQKRLLKDKRGQAFAEAAQILSKKKKKKVKKGELSPEQALEEFAKSFRKKKIEIIEAAFKERIRAGGRITKTELKRARDFMRKAGMSDTNIGFLLAEIFRRQEIQLLRGNFKRGLISEQVFKTRKTKLLNLKEQLISQQRKVNIARANFGKTDAFKARFIKATQQQLVKSQRQVQKQPQQQLIQAKQQQIFKQKTIVRQVQRQRTLQIQKSTQRFLTLQAKTTSQVQRQKQLALFKQAQKAAQKQVQKQQFKLLNLTEQLLRLQGASQATFKNIRRRRKGIASTKTGKITTAKIFPKEKVDEKLIKAVKKLGKGGVNVVVGLQVGKQKIIAKNLPKWKALKKAQRFVDSNIQASFVLKKSGKIAKGKDIKPFIPSRKFRSSKTNPLFRVELRKFRLDSPREVAQLKAFKGKAPKGFFPTKRKRRKKK